MSWRDVLTDVRTWWWRRERASELVRAMADLPAGSTLTLSDDDRHALVERVVAKRERLDDDAAARGPVAADVRARVQRRNPGAVDEAFALAVRQAEGSAVAQRVMQARGPLVLGTDDCARFVAYWRWLDANRGSE